jgi:hypothetical protein
MSAFVNHSVQGGFFYYSLTMIIGYFLKVDLYPLALCFFGVGMFFGMKPDLEEWQCRKSGLNKKYNIDMKAETHERVLKEFWRFEPAIVLHVFQDKVFWHNTNVPQRTKDFVEVIAFLLSATILIIVFGFYYL